MTTPPAPSVTGGVCRPVVPNPPGSGRTGSPQGMTDDSLPAVTGTSERTVHRPAARTGMRWVNGLPPTAGTSAGESPSASALGQFGVDRGHLGHDRYPHGGTGECQGEADLKVSPGPFKLGSGQAADIVGAVSGHRPGSLVTPARPARRQAWSAAGPWPEVRGLACQRTR